jgi:hypothetical protein
VNEPPETVTSACAAKFRDEEVTCGVKAVALMPVRLKVMLAAEDPEFVATITNLLPSGDL